MDPPAGARIDRRFWAAFAICAAAALVPIWTVRYLPMVDLPQHAAQLSAWLHLDDPAMGFADQVELHLFSPYVVPYLLAVSVAKLAGIRFALKVLVTVAVVGLPLSMARLVARRGGDPWWALWGFPLAFGTAFYWGFLSYIATVPLGIVLVDEADAYTREPRLRRGVAVATLAILLFFSHLLVLLPAIAAVALLALHRARGSSGRGVLLAPLVPAAVLAVTWIATAAARESRVQGWEWRFSALRVTLLPQYLFGISSVELSDPVVEHGAAAMAIALVAALLLSRPRLSRSLADWIPLAVAGPAFLFGPAIAFMSGNIADRLSIFVVPFTLAALREGGTLADRRVARAVTVAALLAWMATLTYRFQGFDGEMADAERIWRQMEPNRRVTSLVYSRTSAYLRSAPVFVHAAAWAQAERGGVLASSFFRYVNLPVQYRAGREPPQTPGLDFNPDRFDWSTDGEFDYLLVRAPPPGDDLVSRAPDPLVLVAQEGAWELFRRLSRAPPAAGP